MKKRLNVVSLLFATTLGVSVLTTTSCANKKYDYVTKSSIRLTHDYQGKDFFKDGIAQVKVAYYIDGDTTHFQMTNGENTELIKSRYYGIDTPESTGRVEEYGKDASDFTKSKLEEANKNGTIVVSSVNLDGYSVPEPDSTGVRYLSLVWVNLEKKNAKFNELYLLNLWIVQDGYSYVKGLDKLPDYKDVFLEAEEQAKKLKLGMFCGEPDPRYNYGGYEEASLFDLQNEVVANLKDPNHVNAYENKKVRITGTVAGYTNHILYLQSSLFDETTGETKYAGINVFTTMAQIPSKFTQKNAYIQICGLALTSENFGFQITSVYSFPRGSAKDENDGKVIHSPDKIPDEYKINDRVFKASELDTNYSTLFQSVEVEEEVTITGGYDSQSTPVSVTLYPSVNGTKAPFGIYVPFIYQPDPEKPLEKYKTYNDYVGKTYKVKGIYTLHTSAKKVNYQIVLRDNSDLVLVR